MATHRVLIECATTWRSDNGNGTYSNPLFYDEFSDPDLIRVGEDYYLTGTTMHAMPCLPVLHARDLVTGSCWVMAPTGWMAPALSGQRRRDARQDPYLPHHPGLQGGLSGMRVGYPGERV